MSKPAPAAVRKYLASLGRRKSAAKAAAARANGARGGRPRKTTAPHPPG